MMRVDLVGFVTSLDALRLVGEWASGASDSASAAERRSRVPYRHSETLLRA
jgi:hypothetical protein